ncbi:hypothetical protein ACO11K_001340 [Bacillus cytotoxicus]|uniref:hypothetical protein n=1 Tax=unclassified Bacillus cereus group TaxID=2750818 RepID=UPI001F580DE3|nr:MULTISPECIES: hypothetical protein [unclassified Bacillus cereus group]EMA6341494.1 hypothetical protein [Bacillus cytotoxicus]
MKKHSKLNYTFLVIIFIIAINYLLLPIFNFHATFALLPHVVRVTTTYILPWIFLYWLVRLVKAIESK